MKLALALFIAFAITACCHCQGRGRGRPTTEELNEDFIGALRLGAWHMYRTLIPLNQREDFVFSPLSIQYVLAMLAAGAKGNTEFELLQALKMHELHGNRFDMYNQFKIAKENYFEGVPGVTYPSRLANRAYIENRFTPRQNYREILSRSFAADEARFDRSNAAQTVKSINDWVSHQTNGRIKDLASTDDIKADTVMVLVNALYFKANWKNTFKNSKNKMAWYMDTGETKTINAIETSGEFYFIDESSAFSSGMQYFAIPYDTRDMDVYFVIAVPKRRYTAALKDFEIYMSTNLLVDRLPRLQKRGPPLTNSIQQPPGPGGWVRSRPKLDTLRMPTFGMEKKFDAVELLNQLGVLDIFEAGRADLSGIADTALPLYVSSFKHSANIDVNKEGTEAAAATSATVGARSWNPNGAKEYEINGPYFFGVYQYGNFLFMGNKYTPE